MLVILELPIFAEIPEANKRDPHKQRLNPGGGVRGLRADLEDNRGVVARQRQR